MRWQSPQACTSSPVVGTAARSAAMTAAEPRRKVNGLTAMRPNRMGMSSSSRPTFEATSTSIGSGRSAATDQSPCTPREMTSRRLRPASTCSCSFVSLCLFPTLVIRTASGCSGARPVAAWCSSSIVRSGRVTFSGANGSYGIWPSRCVMTFSRARFLSSEWATYHGAQAVSLAANMSSRACEYSSHFEYDSRSMSVSFQILRGSSIRLSRRRVCSSGLTSSQYFTRMMPESTIAFSTPGTASRKRRRSSSVQKPMTRSTPARLYQLRSKMTISPAAGRCWT